MPTLHRFVLPGLFALLLVACGPDERKVDDPPACQPACGDKVCGDDGCGGSCGTCGEGSDCVSNQCVARPTCSDGAKNGDEVGVDCGGTCDACATGEACKSQEDCETGLCVDNRCQALPTCSDGKMNGGEIDVDCGGTCAACATGKDCESPEDCQTGLCVDDRCQALPTCSDGKKNGEESDDDCGGAGCDACATGRFCRVADDCLSGLCINGVCRDPSCTDEVKNQGETDVDCGGPCTKRCELTKTCGVDGDCASGVCEGGECVACRSTCPGADAARCVGDQVQTCLASSSGCFDWSPIASCGTGRICNASENKCADIGCGDVPVEGRCLSDDKYEYCALATGGGTPFVKTAACGDDERCEDDNGRATCALQAECRDGQTACLNANTLQKCEGGVWDTSACAEGCNDSNPLAAFCNVAGPTKKLTGTLKYMLRQPNAQRTDWGAASAVHGNGFLVASLVDTDGDGKLEPLAVTYTEGEGNFTLDVPTTPGANDGLVVMAVGVRPDGTLRYALGDPGFDAVQEQQVGTLGENPRLWSWAWKLNALPAENALLITEEKGAGAARVFDYLRSVFAISDALYPDKEGLSLVGWVGYGTDWTCGACFAPFAANVFGETFQSQTWIPAGAEQRYWADAVTAHELGHWAMASFGTSPNEGGTHIIGVPTFPGQAWSEGFGTWFSSVVRNDPIYLDKQRGGMFWLDVSSRTYAGSRLWERPVPAGGLLQKMDENEVSAMLWELARSSETADVALMQALASPRMNTDPWLRGYTRHTWEVGSNGQHTDVTDTGVSRPSLPDFLDALVCAGFDTGAVDAATDPSTAYPFPSASPLCQTCNASTCDGCCINGTCQTGNTLAACGANGLQCVACNAGQTCTNGQCVGGTCDASNCASGCCIGTTCVTQTSASQCGTGGGICRTCGTDGVCEAGTCTGGEGATCASQGECSEELVCVVQTETLNQCRATCDPDLGDCESGFNCVPVEDELAVCVPKPSPTSRWRVGFSTASIRVPNPSDGLPWDADNSAPDVFLCLTVVGKEVCTVTVSDSAQPEWNVLTSGDYAYADLASITLELWDEDLFSDDFIDSFQGSLQSPWADRAWTFYPNHMNDPSRGGEYAVVWVEPVP